MNSIIFIIMFVFIYPLVSICQDTCKYPIKWTELKLYVYPEIAPVADTLKTDTGIIVYKISNCMGKGSFVQLNSEEKRILAGEYEESLGLLGFHQPLLDLETGKLVEHVLQQYYEGLKSGDWTYYGPNGKAQRIETYKRGIMVDD